MHIPKVDYDGHESIGKYVSEFKQSYMANIFAIHTHTHTCAYGQQT